MEKVRFCKSIDWFLDDNGLRHERVKGTSIFVYIKFEWLDKKLQNFKIELTSAVPACQLLKNASFGKNICDHVRATSSCLTPEDMKNNSQQFMISAAHQTL